MPGKRGGGEKIEERQQVPRSQDAGPPATSIRNISGATSDVVVGAVRSVFFVPERSAPMDGLFSFGYEPVLSNSRRTVARLAARNWWIRGRGQAAPYGVRAPTIRGQRPFEIPPGGSRSYRSLVALGAPSGQMTGWFEGPGEHVRIAQFNLPEPSREDLAACGNNRADEATFVRRAGPAALNALRDQLMRFSEECRRSINPYELLTIEALSGVSDEVRVGFENLLLKRFRDSYQGLASEFRATLHLTEISDLLPNINICELFVLIEDNAPIGRVHVFGATPHTSPDFGLECLDYKAYPETHINRLFRKRWVEDESASIGNRREASTTVDVREQRDANKILMSWLAAEGIAEADRSVLASKFRRLAQREKSRRKRKPSERKVELPTLPKGLAWPTETFSEASEKRGETIVQFLERVWLPLIKAGIAERRIVAFLDHSVINAIGNYTRPNPRTGERKSLPRHLTLPTLAEVHTRLLKSNPKAVLRDPRLASMVAGRLRRGEKVPGS